MSASAGHILKRMGLAALWTGGCCLLTAVALAQAPLPPTEDLDEEEARERVALSEEARELGREYVEILTDLKRLTADYAKYLAELKTEDAQKERQQLQLLAQRLATGAYLENLERLALDLERTRGELSEREPELRQGNRDLYKITRNLRLELHALQTVLRDVVEERHRATEELAARISTVIEQGNGKGSLDRQKLKKILVMLQTEAGGMSAAPEIHVLEELYVPDFDFDYDFDMDFEEDSMVVFVHGESLQVVVPRMSPQPPKPPKPPKTVVVGPKNLVFTGSSGATTILKEFTDSIEVESAQTPISIINPLGDIHLTSWDQRSVLVRSQIQISSDQAGKAEELMEKVRLTLSHDGDQVLVEYTVPSLCDPQVTINSEYLEIVVPRDNAVSCSGSFGTITSSGLQNQLTVEGHHATIDVADHVGNVAVSNRMGPVALINVEGAMAVTNARDSIVLVDCRGPMTVENRFGPIELRNCNGDARITNTGPVEIGGHAGQVNIGNSNGAVAIRRSIGDFTVHNSLAPVTVEYVEGSIILGNTRAPIIISDMVGSIQAKNQFGLIRASYFTGPIDLTSIRGKVVLLLDREASGPGTVTSNSGYVQLVMEPDINLLVKARTEGGLIQSSLTAASISTAGSVKSAELALGRASQSMTVNGTNATIVFSGEE